MNLKARIRAFMRPDAQQSEITYLSQQLVSIDDALKQSQLNEMRLASQFDAINELLGQAKAEENIQRRKAHRLAQELNREREFVKKLQQDMRARGRPKHRN